MLKENLLTAAKYLLLIYSVNKDNTQTQPSLSVPCLGLIALTKARFLSGSEERSNIRVRETDLE